MCCESFDVTLIKKRFLCCAPLDKIKSAINECNRIRSIDTDVQKEILDNTVNSSLNKKYPVKKSYQKAFLKLLIEKLEKDSVEIYDDVYSSYCDLLASPGDESTHYRHYFIKSLRISGYITVQENINIISEGTTGLCGWQAASALSEWCIENSTYLSGKTILELGCGIGLTGLSVIKTCDPKQYIFSDYHETVLKRTCRNIELNLAQCSLHTTSSSETKLQMKCDNTIVQVIQLDWANIDEYIKENMPLPDIIIAADILYEPNMFSILINGLKAFLSISCSYAIIAVTVRNVETVSQFLDLLAIHNLCMEECTVAEQFPSVQTFDIPMRILKIYQKAC